MTDKKMCDCNQGRLPCGCKADPVPPAGGEPVIYALSRYNDSGGFSPSMVPRETLPEPETREGYVTEADHRSHVTRLQAEMERLAAVLKDRSTHIVALDGENKALQAELTKARELVVEGLKHIGRLSNTVLQCSQGDGLAAAKERCALAYAALGFNQRAQILISNQSAPADKDSNHELPKQ